VKQENAMLTLLKRLILLLFVIGLASMAVVAIVNNTSGSQALSSSQNEFQPGRSTGSRQFQSRPEFDRERGGEVGGGSLLSTEILKNFGIMAGIIFVVTIFRSLIKRFKPTRPVI
jgi:hypothetical protein